MSGHARSSVERRAAAEARRERRASVTDPGIVLEAAAGFLAVRSRSVAETRSRLRHLGYPEPVIEEVLTRLLAMGYLDDVAFGRAWVESRDRSRPRGETILRQELRRKGLDDAVVREVLADRASGVRDARLGRSAPDAALGNEDQPGSVDRTAAERLLARKAAALSREPDPRKRRQKAYALLARNGFDPGVCQAVSRTVTDPRIDAEDEEVDPDALDSGED